MTKIECLTKCREILNAHCDDPATELIKAGEALTAIGKALKGQSTPDARAIIKSIMALEGIGA